ncbi:MAG: 2-oxo acid dehydrogenase subunit E2 [Tepidiformaceae bacterium]
MSVPVALPQADEWPADGAVAEWYQPDGAAVRAGDPVCRVEAGFVSLELDAEGSGILTYRHGIGDTCPADGVLAVIVAEGEPLPDFAEPLEPESQSAVAPESEPEPEAEPVADSTDWIADTPAIPEPERAPVPAAASRNEPFQEWRFDQAPPHQPGVPPETSLPADEAPASPAPTVVDDTHASEPESPPVEGHSATVLPFPRRFTLEHRPGDGSAWDAVPGDAADFASPLVGAAASAEEPDFAAWVDSGHDESESAGDASPQWEWERWAPSEAAAGDHSPAETLPGGLFIRVTVDLGESRKMRDQLAREWKAAGVAPSTDDIALRAVARALRELPAFDATHNLALRAFTPDAETFRVLPRAAGRPFREAVAALAAPPDPETEPGYDCVLTSFAALGIEDATPRLEPGRPFALAVGAEHEVVAMAGEQPVSRVTASLVLAYDASIVDDGTAARLLARVRGLIESPYALLAD